MSKPKNPEDMTWAEMRERWQIPMRCEACSRETEDLALDSLDGLIWVCHECAIAMYHTFFADGGLDKRLQNEFGERS